MFIISELLFDFRNPGLISYIFVELVSLIVDILEVVFLHLGHVRV